MHAWRSACVHGCMKGEEETRQKEEIKVPFCEQEGASGCSKSSIYLALVAFLLCIFVFSFVLSFFLSYAYR
jgi:hypothetical protein